MGTETNITHVTEPSVILPLAHYRELQRKARASDDLLEACKTAVDDLQAMQTRHFREGKVPQWIEDIQAHLLKAITTAEGR